MASLNRIFSFKKKICNNLSSCEQVIIKFLASGNNYKINNYDSASKNFIISSECGNNFKVSLNYKIEEGHLIVSLHRYCGDGYNAAKLMKYIKEGLEKLEY